MVRAPATARPRAGGRGARRDPGRAGDVAVVGVAPGRQVADRRIVGRTSGCGIARDVAVPGLGARGDPALAAAGAAAPAPAPAAARAELAGLLRGAGQVAAGGVEREPRGARDRVLLGGRPGDHRGVRQAGDVLDHVGDHDGDVVRAAALQGELDEPLGGTVRVRRLQGLGDGLLVHDAGQPVAAEQVTVALPQLAQRQVGLHALAAVERLGEQGPLRMPFGLLEGDPALVDHALHERLVVRDHRQLALAQQVGAAVADVRDAEAAAGGEQHRERRPHPVELGLGGDHVAQLLVGLLHGRREDVEQVDADLVLVEVGQRGDRGRARHLAGGVPAHAVRDDREPGTREGGVLVALADVAHVRADGVAQSERHRRSSMTVLPMRTGAPSGTGVGRVILERSR